jgi:hypothetical protein
LAPISAAAAVPTSSSFREMNGIVEAATVTAGPPAAFIDAHIFLE